MVTDHQGTPREIFSEGGQASWAGRLNTWGQMQFWRYREGKAENDPNYTECPFRFAGQYEDEESGLYYNRFRYYDKETGQYLSPDPIGLLGGLNPYGYVHCPTGWVDPFGLAGGKGNKGELDGSGRPLASPRYSVAFETKIDSKFYPGRSDKVHFQEANRNLHEAMKADPIFAKKLEDMYPGITQGVQPGPRGAYPRRSPLPELTWHHEASQPGVMQLVPIKQHQAPGVVQDFLHPGGKGGMSNWGGGR